MMTRKYTEKLLEMIDEGLLDKDTVIMACVKYMSEDDVRDMMKVNEFHDTCDKCGRPLDLTSLGEWGPCEECCPNWFKACMDDQ